MLSSDFSFDELLVVLDTFYDPNYTFYASGTNGTPSSGGV